jgi:hypothetical protein
MIQVHNVKQGSAEWFQARLGMPTASMFATVLAKGKDGGVSATRKTYLMKLAGERLTGEPAEEYSNDYMQRGKVMEAAAREDYVFQTDADLTQVGFVSNGPKGCSPDALVGDDGLLEIKTKAAHLHIEALLRGDFPPEHKAQCQGSLWVTERDWVDLAIYWPKLPLVVYRARRDEAYIRQLASAVDAFNSELEAMVTRVKAYSGPTSVVQMLWASLA